MSYAVSPLSVGRTYGALVQGLKEAQLGDEGTRQALRDLWTEHGLLVFRGDNSPSFHTELSKVFGRLEHHPAREMCHPDFPEIFLLKHDREADPWLYDVGGKVLGGWTPWHFDMAFVPYIPRGAMLRAIHLPRAGGDTGFVDGVELWEQLDPRLKQRVEGIEIIYKMEADFAKHKFASRAAHLPVTMVRGNNYVKSMKARQEKDYPPVVHPAVLTQLGTGRKVLHFSPLMAVGILGMSENESRPLLEALVDHVSNDRFAYFHKWTGSDMVLWDNWRMMHFATGVPDEEFREMWRTTIAGDRNLGRHLSVADLTACRASHSTLSHGTEVSLSS